MPGTFWKGVGEVGKGVGQEDTEESPPTLSWVGGPSCLWASRPWFVSHRLGVGTTLVSGQGRRAAQGLCG